MIGAVGFIVGAACIASFAITATRAYITVPTAKLQLFATGFGLLAAAMLVWALAVTYNQPSSTKILMLVSDSLLVLATGYMVQLVVGRSPIWLTPLLGLAGSLLIGLRAYIYTPTAFIHDGLLDFNLSPAVRAVVVGSFLLVWLPAVVIIASHVAKDKALPGIQNILTLSFVSLVLVTAVFMTAHRPVAIIGLFVIISGLFLAMTAANITIMKLHKTLGATHAASHATTTV